MPKNIRDGTVVESDDNAFGSIVALLDYPMFVVTTSSKGERAGCLVGFASQVSINPPRFLVGLSITNHTFKIACVAKYLAVHVIPAEHVALAELFGAETGDEIDKFDKCAWSSGPHGLPILGDAAAWFSGKVLERLNLGDHVAFLLTPETGYAPDDLSDLVTFADVRNFEAGHEA